MSFTIPKISNPENKFPAFSIALCIYFYNRKKDKVSIADMVRKIYRTNQVAKDDEQRIRNITLSIAKHGVTKNSHPYKIFLKGDSLQDIQIDISELIDYLFQFIGEYKVANISDEFYATIRKKHEKSIKRLIKLYLDFRSSDIENLDEWCFSDAITDLENLLVRVSKNKDAISKIRDESLKDLIQIWSESAKKELNKEIEEFSEKLKEK
tara:strand:+ start:23 stop:649 length:627 start_codon:yes stop_codon:yes gene_type:complete